MTAVEEAAAHADKARALELVRALLDGAKAHHRLTPDMPSAVRVGGAGRH